MGYVVNVIKTEIEGRIRFQAQWSEQSVLDVTMTQFDSWLNYAFAKLRHRDVKNALKTNAAEEYDFSFKCDI